LMKIPTALEGIPPIHDYAYGFTKGWPIIIVPSINMLKFCDPYQQVSNNGCCGEHSINSWR